MRWLHVLHRGFERDGELAEVLAFRRNGEDVSDLLLDKADSGRRLRGESITADESEDNNRERALHSSGRHD